MPKTPIKSADNPALNLDAPDDEVIELIAHLQGFELDLLGNRYSPYEVLFAESVNPPRDEEVFGGASQNGPPSAIRSEDCVPPNIKLARNLGVVLDQQIDRKLKVASQNWPGPDKEPLIRLPVQLLFNALKLAELLQLPALLGESLHRLYAREQEQPFFNGEIRSALLGAMLANQRHDEYVDIWSEISQEGHSRNAYFVANPKVGRQGMYRTNLASLKKAFASVSKKLPPLRKQQLAEAFEVAEAIRWRSESHGTVEMKSKFKELVDELVPQTGSTIGAWRIIELAGACAWPKWMCRRLPLVTPLQKESGRTRLCLRGELYFCVSADRFVSAPKYLAKSGFVQVDLQDGDQSLIDEVNAAALSFRDLLEKNVTSSESKEVGDILDWYRDMEERSKNETTRKQLRRCREKEINYFTKDT